MTYPHAFVIYLVLGALVGAGLSVLNLLYARDADTPTEPRRHVPRLALLLGYFAGVLLMAATGYRYDPSRISHYLWWTISAFTSFLLVMLVAKALRNHRARSALRRWRYGAAAAGLMVCLMLTGCGANSLNRCYQAKEAYAALTETVADLRDQGIIPQSQVVASKPYRVAARAALKAWEDAARANDTTTANTWEQKFKDAAAFVQSLADSYAPKPHSEAEHDRDNYSLEHHQVDRRIVVDRGDGEPANYGRRVVYRERSDCGRRYAA